MDKKQIKKIVNKNVKLAKKSANELKEISKAEYEKLRKEIQKNPQVKDLEKKAQKELAKIQKQLAEASKKAEGYIKKNPGKAAAISAAVGAALGGAIAIMAGKKKR